MSSVRRKKFWPEGRVGAPGSGTASNSLQNFITIGVLTLPRPPSSILLPSFSRPSAFVFPRSSFSARLATQSDAD